MLRELFKKHNCYKTCYCEGRTSKDGIERMNAYSSLIYVLIACIMLETHRLKLTFIVLILFTPLNI